MLSGCTSGLCGGVVWTPRPATGLLLGSAGGLQERNPAPRTPVFSLGFSVCTSCGFASPGPARPPGTVQTQHNQSPKMEDSLSNSKGDVARRGTWGASQGLRDVAGPGREESGGGTVEDLHTEDFWVGGTPLSLPFVKRTTAAQRKNGVGEGSRRGHPPAPGVFPHRLWLLPSLF